MSLSMEIRLRSLRDISCRLGLKVRGSHLTYKVASKYLNVRKRVEVVDKNKDDPLSSLAFL